LVRPADPLSNCARFPVELRQLVWEDSMKIARTASFVLAAAAMLLTGGAAQAALKTQWINYMQGSAPLSGYLVYDDAVQGRQPGVLMIHDRSGFSEGTLTDAAMIAKLGYVVFAEDMFGKGVVPDNKQPPFADPDRPKSNLTQDAVTSDPFATIIPSDDQPTLVPGSVSPPRYFIEPQLSDTTAHYRIGAGVPDHPNIPSVIQHQGAPFRRR
jgi:hypothetical protein